MASKPRKRAKQQQPRDREPTTAQHRQAYYEARARRTALEELDLVDIETPRPAPDRRAALEALDAFDRLMVLYGICRWTALSGEPPEPEDWVDDKDWPQPEAVESLFGSWDEALAESGVLDSSISVLLDRVAKAQQELRARGEELEKTQKRLEEDAAKIPELERQMERHKALRDEAGMRATEVEGERERLIAERDDARRRAEEAEARAAALEAAPAPVAASADDAALRDEAAAARAEVTRLHDELAAERAEHDHARRTIAELSQLVARLDASGAGEDTALEAATSEEPAPETVLEAVRQAAASARHLRFAPRAFETAEDSPFRRPGLVLRALRQLDDLAARYAEGDMGKSLSQAAQEVGITQWKAGVSELARTRWRDEYLVAIDGREYELGPHVGLGSGSGAGFVAHIYLHVADGNDDLPRGITVGVVGRHLPDTTT